MMRILSFDRTQNGILVAILSLAVAVAAVVLPNFWWKIPGASVTYNGRASSKSSVYRAWNGRYMVVVREISYPDYYIFDLNDPYINALSVCNADLDEFAAFPGLAVSKDNPVPCEAMPGLMELVNPHLLIGKASVAFTTGEKVRVRASL